MNVTCTADVCPIALNAKCVFYESSALPNTGIATNDSIQVALQKLDAIIADVGAGTITSVNGDTGPVVVLTAGEVGAAAPGDNISIFTNDSGYITGAIADGDYWKLSGTSIITANTIIDGTGFTLDIVSNNTTLLNASGQSGFYTDGTGTALVAGAGELVSLISTGDGVGGGGIVISTTGSSNGIRIQNPGESAEELFFGVAGGGGGLQYAADYSVGFNDRSLIDRGFGNSNYWKTAGTTTLTATNSITGQHSINITNAQFNLATLTSATRQISISTTGVGTILQQFSTLRFDITDSRTGANQKGIEYAADYSSNFTDRSLIDRGFANSNYWKTVGITTLSGNPVINTDPAGSVSIYNSASDLGLNISESTINFGGGQGSFILLNTDASGSFSFIDNRTSPEGIQYVGDYSATFTNRSLVDKEYVDLAVAAGGGITNSAINGELMMSDGTDAISSNVHMSGTGSTLAMTLGNSSYVGSNRFFGSAGSAADVGLQMASKGASELLLGGTPVVAHSNSTTLSGVLTAFKVRTRSAGGIEAPGIGVAIAFETETDTGNFEIGGMIESVATDVTAGSEDFDFKVYTMTAGASSLKATLNAGGLLLSNTSGDIFSAAVAGGGRNGLLVQLSNSAGLVGSRFENDLSVVGHFYVGGSTTTNSNFGVSRQNRVALIADGASNAGMIIGTITADDVILGAADTNLLRLSSSLNIGLFGASTFDTGVGVLALQNASTAPAASDPDLIMIYSRNSSDGTTNATLALQLEQAVEAIGTFTASHKIKVWINNVEYWLQLDAV